MPRKCKNCGDPTGDNIAYCSIFCRIDRQTEVNKTVNPDQKNLLEKAKRGGKRARKRLKEMGVTSIWNGKKMVKL